MSDPTSPLPFIPPPPAPPQGRFVMPPPPPTVIKPFPKWIWISLAVIILAIGGATYPVYKLFIRNWHKVDPLVTTLHARMVSGNDQEIFDNADPAYQKTGLDQSNQLFDFIRTELGSPKSFSTTGQNISADSRTGTILTLVVSTTFDKGIATETIKFHKINGDYKLIDYNIVSPQLKNEDIPENLRPKKEA